MAEQLPKISATHLAFTATTSSVVQLVAVAEPSERLYLLIQNQDAAIDLYINVAVGGNAVSSGHLILSPGFSYEPLAVPQGPISVASASGTVAGCIIYQET
jgi:hypothetical protein